MSTEFPSCIPEKHRPRETTNSHTYGKGSSREGSSTEVTGLFGVQCSNSISSQFQCNMCNWKMMGIYVYIYTYIYKVNHIYIYVQYIHIYFRKCNFIHRVVDVCVAFSELCFKKHFAQSLQRCRRGTSRAL